jgi:hypothetical protein
MNNEELDNLFQVSNLSQVTSGSYSFTQLAEACLAGEISEEDERVPAVAVAASDSAAAIKNGLSACLKQGQSSINWKTFVKGLSTAASKMYKDRIADVSCTCVVRCSYCLMLNFVVLFSSLLLWKRLKSWPLIHRTCGN